MNQIKNFFKEFSFLLKKDEQLTLKDKAQMHDLLIKTYPLFSKYYKKNKYYSTIKPQMNYLIREKSSDKIIGTGKFLWRNIKFNDEKIRLFAFGLIIDKKFQNKGLGTQLIREGLKQAKKMKADLYYSSTSSPGVKKLLEKLGFKKLSSKVVFKHALTGKKQEQKNDAYVFGFKKGVIDKINSMKKIDIGIGPI